MASHRVIKYATGYCWPTLRGGVYGKEVLKLHDVVAYSHKKHNIFKSKTLGQHLILCTQLCLLLFYVRATSVLLGRVLTIVSVHSW